MNEFDAKAATWDDNPRRAARTAAVAAAIVEQIELTPDFAVLEYGAGTGALGRTLAPRVGRVVLLDSSAGMVEVARQRIAEDSLANVEAVEGDLDVMAPSDRFDLVVAVLVLHHVSDVPAALARFATLLKPGGRLVIVDLDEDVDHAYHDEGFNGHHGFERTALSRDLEAAGFGELSWRTVFQMQKTLQSGVERTFPLFMAIGRLSGSPDVTY